MYPELFELPFIHITVKTYGVMMVIGFLAAMLLMRKMAVRTGDNPDYITNAALYALIAGVIGARVFFVVHHFSEFRGSPASVFALWRGGLEFVGGVIVAVIVTLAYLLKNKLSVRKYMDILAVGLMLGLAFGRIGCFFSGCCFGKPAEVPWAIRFPYGSNAYNSQIFANPQRDRLKPRLELPEDFFYHFIGEDEKRLKPFGLLTLDEKEAVTKGIYRCLPVHPSQFYSSANAIFLCALLYLFWRKFSQTRPGCTLGLMFVLYGITRFGLEYLRDDNPFEEAWWAIYKGGTISQNLGIYMAVLGVILMTIFRRQNSEDIRHKT